jgi:hypothetical protein
VIRSRINPVSEEGSLFDVPPAALGRFRVLHQIGAGTLGPVFRASDPGSETIVAIKLFTINLFPQDAASVAKDLAQLVAMLPRLSSAVSPIEAGLEHHVPFLATTLAAGDSLDVALREFGPAAIADLLPRVAALADTLDEAARREVYHGALHARDLMVAEHDTRLTGLGIVPILARHGVQSSIRRPYAAPELADGQFSGEADQYALAALTFEWMTGRKANGTATEVPTLPGVNRVAMAEVFARAFHEDPAERFESCASFVEAVTEAAGDAATLAEVAPAITQVVPTTPSRTPRPRKEEPTLPLDAFPEEGAADALSREVAALEGETIDQPAAAVDAAESVDTVLGQVHTPEMPGDTPAERFTSIDVPHIGHDPVLPAPRPHAPLGSLSIPEPPFLATPPESRGGSGRILIAALVGIGLGVIGGYYLWGGSMPFARDEAVAEQPARPAGQSATDVPIDPSTPAGATGGSPGGGTPSGAEPGAGSSSPTAAPGASTGTAGAAAAPAAAGRLLVRSDPSGATVFVDDERRGVTPISLTGLRLGNRRIRVQRDGYVSQDRAVSLTSERPSRSVDVSLSRRQVAGATPAPAPPPPRQAGASAVRTGSLLVESRPPGATVTVNGAPRGLSPVTLSGLAPGEYTVQLQLPGYRTITTTVRVVAGERARAAASLTEQERE